MTEEPGWFVGNDWASEVHQVCLVDAAGKITGERRFPHGGVGLAELSVWLLAMTGAAPAAIAMAIEVPRGPIVETLLGRGFPVYAVNPKQLDRLRDRFTVAGAKDNRRDAHAVGDALRTDRQCFRCLVAEEAVLIELREWSNVVEDLQQECNRLSNRVREQLWHYYPQALAISDDLAADWFLKLRAAGIVVNARGKRFLDEGLDFHSYTYAKYGSEILNQPGMFAWQIFDQKVTHLLREEYRIPRITKEKADTFEALAERLEGVDARRFLDTIRAFNAAPRPEVPFNPNIRDGLATRGLAIDKTNWAQRLDQPPYEAYAVTTGITFTFGGLKITNNADVEETSGHPIPGLYAAGEIVGGLFYHNYASGTGLMSGAVFGRLAGRSAAHYAKG